MQIKILYIFLLLISSLALAESQPVSLTSQGEHPYTNTELDSEISAPDYYSDFSWFASTGIGYDSNVFQTPKSTYTDYSQSIPLSVEPQVESGFYVPYEFGMNASKSGYRNSRLLGLIRLSGNYYQNKKMADANNYKLLLRGGSEYIVARNGKFEDTLYIGALAGNYEHVFVGHDTGLENTAALSDSEIVGRYSFMNLGVETKYKHRLGDIDYSFVGQYILNDYKAPLSAAQLDHSTFTLGGDISVQIELKSRLRVAFEHTQRDYSKRLAFDAQGMESASLTNYKYNELGITYISQIVPDWLMFIDYGKSTRLDDYARYDDYGENRFGARMVYEHGRSKTMMGLHRVVRHYPNGHIFNNPTLELKANNGIVFDIRREIKRTDNSTLWSSLVYKSDSTSDPRYGFTRYELMAGFSWAY